MRGNKSAAAFGSPPAAASISCVTSPMWAQHILSQSLIASNCRIEPFEAPSSSAGSFRPALGAVDLLALDRRGRKLPFSSHRLELLLQSTDGPASELPRRVGREQHHRADRLVRLLFPIAQLQNQAVLNRQPRQSMLEPLGLFLGTDAIARRWVATGSPNQRCEGVGPDGHLLIDGALTPRSKTAEEIRD